MLHSLPFAGQFPSKFFVLCERASLSFPYPFTEPGVRPIGMYPIESRWGGSKEAIRKRLSEKAKRYKNLGEQFVIAVNCVSR